MAKKLTVTDVKVFAPTKDFELSISFYKALGWVCNWSDGQYAEMELGGIRFFLQKYYHKGWANNFMFYINVEDVQAWYEHASKVIKDGDYGKGSIRPPNKLIVILSAMSGTLLAFYSTLLKQKIVNHNMFQPLTPMLEVQNMEERLRKGANLRF